MKRYTIDNSISKLPKDIKEKFVITGYPRNDILLQPSSEARSTYDSFISDENPETVILYAPTKHYGISVGDDDPAVNFFPFADFNHSELDKFLENNSILLLLRPHPRDVRRMNSSYDRSYVLMKEQIDKLISESEHVRLCTQYEIKDSVNLLPFVDILITDYSSIYHDFLLLDRPIIFIPYDYDEFKKQKGFNYAYYEKLPGPDVENFDNFKKTVSKFIDKSYLFADKREKLTNLVHCYQDSNSRRRVVNEIKNKIETEGEY